MRTRHPKGTRITAGELMSQLEKDPGYMARVQEKEKQREAAIEENLAALAPISAELRASGYDVDSLDVLARSKAYKGVVPILLKWLPTVTNRNIKEFIVRALSVPWAKPSAARPLVNEFRNLPESDNIGLKWAIGNALEAVGTDEVFDEIVELLRDKHHGRAREMLAMALGKMKNPHAVDVLIELLDDDEVACNAIIGLGKLKAQKAWQHIQPFVSHPKAWIRKEAKRALAKLDK